MRLTTPITGLALDVTAETLPELGRVIYVVDRVGTFTIERDPHGYPDRDPAISCTYGRHDTDTWASGYRLLPEAPVVYRVPVGGGAVFGIEKWLTLDYLDDARAQHAAHGYIATLPARRGNATTGEVAGSLPEGTARRVTDIVLALALDFVGRDDYDALVHAQAVLKAPSRLTQHQRDIDRLAEQIATLTAQLDHQRHLADIQLALIPEEAALAS